MYILQISSTQESIFNSRNVDIQSLSFGILFLDRSILGGEG